MQHIKLFAAPARPSVKSEDPLPPSNTRVSDSQTRIDQSKVKRSGQPDRFEATELDALMGVLRASLKDAIMSPNWPSADCSEPDGFLRQLRRRVNDVAVHSGELEGENGISHQLQETFFAFFNHLMLVYFRDETRIWKVISKRQTGSTDWGLFCNNVLVVIVELKPSSVGVSMSTATVQS